MCLMAIVCTQYQIMNMQICGSHVKSSFPMSQTIIDDRWLITPSPHYLPTPARCQREYSALCFSSPLFTTTWPEIRCDNFSNFLQRTYRCKGFYLSWCCQWYPSFPTPTLSHARTHTCTQALPKGLSFLLIFTHPHLPLSPFLPRVLS